MTIKEQTKSKSTASVLLNQEKMLEKKTNFPRVRNDLLERIGVIGNRDTTQYLFASIFTGKPILYVGPPGTGKTYMVKQISKFLLSYSYSCIDAAKCNFEELQGYVDLPKYMNEGKIAFLETEQSIRGKGTFFVDEINRGSTQVQNGLLEITQSKTLNGLPLEKLDWIVAACNPLTSEGTTALTSALADRIMFTVDTQELSQMTDREKELITEQGSAVDDKVLKKWMPEYEGFQAKYPNLNDEFLEYMQGCGEFYLKVMKEFKIAKYSEAFCTAYETSLSRANKDDSLDSKYRMQGRRMNMMRDAITAVLAIELYEYDQYLNPLPDQKRKEVELTSEEMTSWIRSTILDTVRAMVNIEATGKELLDEHLSEAHSLALQHIDADSFRTGLYDIRTSLDVTEKIWKAIAYMKEYPLEISPAFGSISDKMNISKDLKTFNNYQPTKLKTMESYDLYIPLLFLYDPQSPFKEEIFNKLPKDIRSEIENWLKLCYYCAGSYDWDNDIPESIKEYSLRKTYKDVGDKEANYTLTPEDVYTEEYFALTPIEKIKREVAFRRFMAYENKYASLVVIGMKQNQIEDKDSKAYKDLEAEYERKFNDVIEADARRSIAKTDYEFKKIEKILSRTSFADLI